jgi:hypothetical protein
MNEYEQAILAAVHFDGFAVVKDPFRLVHESVEAFCVTHSLQWRYSLEDQGFIVSVAQSVER